MVDAVSAPPPARRRYPCNANACVVRKAAFGGPGLTQERHSLVVALAGFLYWNAEAVELTPPIGFSDAEIEPSVGEKV
jgi:hypothetical protein